MSTTKNAKKNTSTPAEPRKRVTRSAQPKKALTPQAATIEAAKERFIKALASNGGVVSDALTVSKLARKTAYDHFKADPAFAELWLGALETAGDSLTKEAIRRSVKGVDRPVYQNGKKVGSVREYSDTLLIFMMKRHDAQQKWRGRITQAGNIALETIRSEGKAAGLSEEQILQIQNATIAAFGKISMV